MPRYRWREPTYAADGPRKLAEQYRATLCLLYQSTAGDLPRSALYIALERVAARIAGDLLDFAPLLDGIPWDFPEPPMR